MKDSGFPVINTLLEGAEEWVSAAQNGDTTAARQLFDRYGAAVFSYIFFLSSAGRDAAFDKTAELMARRLAVRRLEDEGSFLADCLREARDAARSLPVRAAFDAPSASEGPAAGAQRLLKEALERLSFDEKAYLLLRDQLCLPYALIAQVHATDERQARLRVEKARLALREALEGILRRKEGVL